MDLLCGIMLQAFSVATIINIACLGITWISFSLSTTDDGNALKQRLQVHLSVTPYNTATHSKYNIIIEISGRNKLLF